MNSLFASLGIESWKPLLTALLLPPAPWLLLVLIGARLILPRRGLGWLVILASVALLWLSTCVGTAQLLMRHVLKPPPALGREAITALRSTPRAPASTTAPNAQGAQGAQGAPAPQSAPTAIVVLGGGLEPYAPEYGVANLTPTSLERLRYGVWLGRETGLPVAFSGGVGWAQPDALPEARIAERIAANEYGRPLKWVEDVSRDTRQNARRTIALLQPAGVRRIVLVTHAVHMPRALRDFDEAAAGAIRIEPAPIGLATGHELPVLRWVPSSKGAQDVREIVRELLGRLAGA